MAIQDPNELERVLLRRAREKAAAQTRSRHISQAIDREGQVTVWDFAAQQYRRIWPVDAAEQIGRGLAALKGSETPEAVAPPVKVPEPPVDEPPPVESPPPDPEPEAPKAAKSKGKARDSGRSSNPPPDSPPAS